MNIKELIEDGVDFLGSHQGARLDCEVILAFTIGENKEYLIAYSDQEVGDAMVRMYYHYLDRLKAGEPVAYIIQQKEFFGLNFFVDKRVLIPRPETEQVVSEVISFVEGSGEAVRFLDVGTGSGNIPLSVVNYFKVNGQDIFEKVMAFDLSEGALEVARMNAEQLGVDDQVEFFGSDLLEVLDEGESFDVITANLPYIGEEKNRFVSPSAEKYEPHMALFGGADGLVLYRRMFDQIRDKGIGFKLLIGEFGFAQSEDVAEMLEEYFSGKWRIVKDLAGIDRLFMIYV